jgi:hypothetical protein
MAPVPGATVILGDFSTPGTRAAVLGALETQPDVVLSDMAHSFVGVPAVDHAKQMALARCALEFALQVHARARGCVSARSSRKAAVAAAHATPPGAVPARRVSRTVSVRGGGEGVFRRAAGALRARRAREARRVARGLGGAIYARNGTKCTRHKCFA